MLEYGKAVQESVYEQLRVVREGHLRIIFTHDLKVWIIYQSAVQVLYVFFLLYIKLTTLLLPYLFQILSWEFCARRHEELLPRKLVAPQVFIL